MKIAYVSAYDATDIHNWSGLGHYIAQSLENQEATISYTKVEKNFSLKNRIKSLIYNNFLRKSFTSERTLYTATQYAKSAKGLISSNTDVIFAPGTIPIALLETDKPKVFYTDSAFAGMIGLYDSFSNLCPEIIRAGNKIEQSALNSCSLAIYASEWAAKTAMENYDVNPAKIKVVPFGANVDTSRTVDDIKNSLRRRSRTTCKLLFLGVDWERKGGNLAVAVAGSLNASGIKTELHVAGIKAYPNSEIPEHVINHGFISKSTIEGRLKLGKLFDETHFLILPTRAECFGVVFCEASSYGVPSIATSVGGVPTAVKNNINGQLFDLTEGPEGYAIYISELFTNYDRYESLALSSFEEYQTRLNWKTAGKSIVDLLKYV